MILQGCYSLLAPDDSTAVNDLTLFDEWNLGQLQSESRVAMKSEWFDSLRRSFPAGNLEVEFVTIMPTTAKRAHQLILHARHGVESYEIGKLRMVVCPNGDTCCVSRLF